MYVFVRSFVHMYIVCFVCFVRVSFSFFFVHVFVCLVFTVYKHINLHSASVYFDG